MRFRHTAFNSVAIAIAVWLTSITLRPLIEGGGYVTNVAMIAALAAAIGGIGTLARLPRGAIIAAQGLSIVALLAVFGLRTAASEGIGEGAGTLDRLIALGNQAVETVQNQTAPLSSSPALDWLIAVVLALILITTELLVDGLEQPAWAVAPLVAVYGVSAIVLPAELGLSQFSLIAIGYVLILVTSTSFGGGARSGTPAQAASFEVARFGTATVLTALTLLAAFAVTPLIPLGSKQPWLEAGRDTPIELSDPTIHLAEDLRRPSPSDVLTYSTQDGRSVYLRAVALPQITANGAQLVPMTLTPDGLAEAYDVPGTELETQVHMFQQSEYLPAPFAVDSYSARGQWAYDPSTLAVIAISDDRTSQTVDLEYQVRSIVPEPSREDVAQAEAGVGLADESMLLSLPEGLSDQVVQLTESVTAQSTSAGSKALAIQDFLQSDAFTYTLDAPDSTGLDTLSAFLLEDRSGYCIHFATAMAVMARISGIPSRIAIGYTGGQATEDGSYLVTTDNAHAWPELYFESLGWVAFEPTQEVAPPPSYTEDEPEDEPSSSPSPSPTPSASSEPESTSPPPSASPSPTQAPGDEPSNGGGGSSGWLWWVLAVAVIVVVAFIPAAARIGLRWWRLRPQPAPEAAEGAWREVRATAKDLGYAWSDASPVLAVQRLNEQIGTAAAEPLRSIAVTVERIRYARDGVDTGALADQVRAWRHDLVGQAGRATRLRAWFTPASLRPGSAHGADPAESD
ncbi:MAG: transglutaminaseTgpA domain-containing protein [Arachnia sp.]